MIDFQSAKLILELSEYTHVVFRALCRGHSKNSELQIGCHAWICDEGVIWRYILPKAAVTKAKAFEVGVCQHKVENVVNGKCTGFECYCLQRGGKGGNTLLKTKFRVTKYPSRNSKMCYRGCRERFRES